MTMIEQVVEFREDLEMFSDANDKVEYILELASINKTTIDEDERTSENFVQGCSSSAWLISQCVEGVLHFRARGESSLAKGMIGLLFSIYNTRTAEEILAFDPKELYTLGIKDLLSPTRQQSLEAFLGYIYDYAKNCKKEN